MLSGAALTSNLCNGKIEAIFSDNMIIDYKKMDLYGKSFIQKVVLKPPFDFAFPVAEQACFLYMIQGEMQDEFDDDFTKSFSDKYKVTPTRYRLNPNG